MGYHVVDPADLDRSPDHPSDRRSVAEAVGLSTLAAAVYEIRPGEQLPTTYHYHENREELFFVAAGTLSIQTPDGTYAVESGELFVAEPDSPHLAHVPDDADEAATVLGVGAPQYDVARPYDPDDESGAVED